MDLAVEFIFLLFFLGLFVFFVVQTYNIVFRGYAPFLATKKGVVKRIVEELELKDGGILYELGAGRAGFLRAARKKHPKAKLVGVEYAWLPYILAQIQNVLTNSRIKIIKKNIFEISLRDADAIYCYLNIDTMRRLEEVFKKELKSGARVISYQFPLPNKKADKVIDIEGKKDKIYFYNY